MSLWDWALEAYARPGAADACLHLQDAHEQSVPLLLWGAWVAATGRWPDEDTIEAACDTARAWEAAAVAPLRAVRRTLKAPIPDMDDDARQAVRERIKAVELEAERAVLAALEALSGDPEAAPRPTVDGMVAAARQWARVIPRPALIQLAERLPA
jgi:uncharacterized protein (TIGR02444 family)